MRITHNISAINTYRQLTANTNATSSSLEKLSSGLRVNRSGDDAAGLAISEKMRGQIRGLDQAVNNTSEGINLIQTAEGALIEVHDILQRMRGLAVQSANDTNTDFDRAEAQKEIDRVTSEITMISDITHYNTQYVLNGSMQATASTSAAGIESVTMAPGAILESGTYNISITDYRAEVKAVPSSLVTAKGTYTGGADKTFTYHKADGTNYSDDGWYAAGATTPTDAAAFAAEGITVGGTAQENAQIKAVAAVGGTPASITVEQSDEISGVKEFYKITATGSGGNVSGRNFAFKFKSSFSNSSFQVTVDASNALKFHIGANSGQNTILSINKMDAASMGVDKLDVTTQLGADAAITTIDNAITYVSAQRTALGAMQNRLEHTVSNLNTSSENLTSSESQIRDVDMASEMMNYTRNNILTQAAQAMLAQSNQQPQAVLQLLRS